jgi:GTPase SAR1 family protein
MNICMYASTSHICMHLHTCICVHTHTHNEQVTDKESFEHVETWIREIKKFTNDSEVRIVVVGNKIDLASCRQVSGICLVSDQGIF